MLVKAFGKDAASCRLRWKNVMSAEKKDNLVEGKRCGVAKGQKGKVTGECMVHKN